MGDAERWERREDRVGYEAGDPLSPDVVEPPARPVVSLVKPPKAPTEWCRWPAYGRRWRCGGGIRDGVCEVCLRAPKGRL